MNPILALLPPQSATIVAAFAINTIGTVVARLAGDAAFAFTVNPDGLVSRRKDLVVGWKRKE